MHVLRGAYSEVRGCIHTSMHAIGDRYVHGIDAGFVEHLFIRTICLRYVELLRGLLCSLQVSGRDGGNNDIAVGPSWINDGGRVDSGR